MFLRAVKNAKGEMDCLDLVDDVPTTTETVYVYRLEGQASPVHLNFGGGKGGFYTMGEYRHMPDVDGQTLRDNAAWQAWALEHTIGVIQCPVDHQPCNEVVKACCSCPRNESKLRT